MCDLIKSVDMAYLVRDLSDKHQQLNRGEQNDLRDPKLLTNLIIYIELTDQKRFYNSVPVKNIRFRLFHTAVEAAQDHWMYFAKQLYQSMKGIGTNDSKLIYIIVFRCEVCNVWNPSLVNWIFYE